VQVTVTQAIGQQTGGKASGLEIGHAGVVNVYPTLPGAPRVHVPPAARHPLFGRAAELAQITAALRERRTVLLHGMGGIGKTALAAAAAQDLFHPAELSGAGFYPTKLGEAGFHPTKLGEAGHADGGFVDGVLWASEIGAATIAAVCDAVARGLGDDTVPRLPPPAKPDATRALLAGRKLLLVLDDLAAAETAGVFLACCLPAGIALLATGRQRHPDFDLDLPIRPLARDDAMALFRDRAKMPDADGIVGEICDLLENHPLALVIAAGRARVEAMPLPSLRARLADEKTRLRALKLGDGGDPLTGIFDKNRNVWASLQLSWEGLNAGQRRALTTLAACSGESAGLEFLAEACELPSPDRDLRSPGGDLRLAECEDHLGGLVMRSLAQREGDRFTLHRLVRDFGRDAPGGDPSAGSPLPPFGDLAELALNAVKGQALEAAQDRVLRAAQAYVARYDQKTPEHHDRLEAELGNLLGAVRHAADRQAWTVVLALTDMLCLPVSGVLGVRGYWAELVEVGRLGIAAAERSRDRGALARLAHNTAVTLQNQGDYAEARRLYGQSLETFQKLGNQAGIASSLHQLGRIAQDQGDSAEARRLYGQSLETFQKLGDQAGIARSLHQLGVIAQDQGNYAEARRLYGQSLEINRKLGDQAGIALTIWGLGNIAMDQGQQEEARRCYRESLAAFEKLGDIKNQAGVLHQLGRIAQDQGDYAEARRLYGQSLETFQKLGNQAGIASSLHQLGNVAYLQGDYAEARRLYGQSLEIEQKLGDQAGIASSLHQLGRIAHDQGDYAEARRLYGQSLETFERLRSPHAETARRNLAKVEEMLK
jgi:tetratricopeptide (TPR) repeat protein